MYSKYSSVVNFGGTPLNAAEYKLKQHHHVKLDAEFKFDCSIWLEFLQGHLRDVVSRPMVDLLSKAQNSEDICFYSDASALEVLGFGALLDTQWIQATWNTDFILRNRPSIEYLELFALCAGVFTWREQMTNCRIAIFCDNMGVVHMINNMVSSCPQCMVLIRLLILDGLKYNRRITAKYVSTKSNFLADALSRGQMTRFRKLGPHMNPEPSKLPEEIWPMEKMWRKF